jgi:uncharacterized membrane protein YgaE (UPF0421/DUF939 family)
MGQGVSDMHNFIMGVMIGSLVAIPVAIYFINLKDDLELEMRKQAMTYNYEIKRMEAKLKYFMNGKG